MTLLFVATSGDLGTTVYRAKDFSIVHDIDQARVYRGAIGGVDGLDWWRATFNGPDCLAQAQRWCALVHDLEAVDAG